VVVIESHEACKECELKNTKMDKMKKMKRSILIIVILILQLSVVAAQSVYNILDYGAVPGGKTLNTKSIQNAIDDCFANGGGKVLIPKGVFLSGTIVLKSNITLYLDPSAELLGSPSYDTDFLAFPYHKFDSKENDLPFETRQALIYADGQDNIAIMGFGTINGNGGHEKYRSKNMFNGKAYGQRPFSIWFHESTNIKLHNIKVVDGAFWNIMINGCKVVDINGLTIKSEVVANNDGIDITDSSNVRIVNCDIATGDDAICFKSNTREVVKNIVISNCIIRSHSSAIKFGVASFGGFQDVAITNCTLYDTRLSGIDLMIVEGGIMDRIVISNITMHNVNGSIFMKAASNEKTNRAPSIMRNIIISNVIADGIGEWKADTTQAYMKHELDSRIGITITGQEDCIIENVSFSNIHLQFAGGGTVEDAALPLIDRLPHGYPKYDNFGITPAYGINCKYLKNVRFHNVVLDYKEKDVRPAFYIENSQNITLNGIDARVSDETKAYIRVNSVEGLLVQQCKPKSANVPFLSLEGKSRDITIMSNDFSKIKSPFITDATFNKKELNFQFNIKK
jgi:hypothetical protein